ncbi:hypothetical protein CsSME_00000432 [Camellia sinensis var. sinensis]
MWDALIEHAKTCAMSGKLYVYYADDTRNVGVVFNSIYELSGLITGEQYLLSDSLSDSQKLYVDTLVKKAYDNWNHVVEYDGKSLLSFKQSKRPGTSRNELLMGPVDYPTSFENQLPQQRLLIGGRHGLFFFLFGLVTNCSPRLPKGKGKKGKKTTFFLGCSWVGGSKPIG